MLDIDYLTQLINTSIDTLFLHKNELSPEAKRNLVIITKKIKALTMEARPPRYQATPVTTREQVQ